MQLMTINRILCVASLKLLQSYLRGTLTKEEFQEKAEEMRATCQSEIMTSGAVQKLAQLVGDKPMLPSACNGGNCCGMHRWGTGGMKESEDNCEGWQLMSLAVDSGAAETVIPYDLISGHGIHETESSRAVNAKPRGLMIGTPSY